MSASMYEAGIMIFTEMIILNIYFNGSFNEELPDAISRYRLNANGESAIAEMGRYDKMAEPFVVKQP